MSNRPSPEALLQQAHRESRGKLKLFLGAAPGVGKTYAMLRAAHQRQAEGIDVCIGLLEAHGRRDTEAQMKGLELLSRQSIDYRGHRFEELAVDAIVERRPTLILIDEFAHSNVPGSRHPKRYQDIEELLKARIDVYSTLNVQHIESLNDVVASITGVQVRETIPDKVVRWADEIELIDLPPAELIQRLKDGKVYVPEQARKALHQYFGRGALTALRELAMRVAAEHVDEQLLEYKQAHAKDEPWPTRERLLVCVSDADISQTVVRAARRIAENRRIPWIALYVETPRTRRLSISVKERVARNLRLADRLGATIRRVQGDDLLEETLACARRENVSQIVVGRPESTRWRLPWARSLAGTLIRKAAPLEVTVVTWSPPKRARARPTLHVPTLRSPLKAYVVATAGAAVVSGTLMLVPGNLPVDAKAIFYLLATVAVAARYGVWPSIYYALISFMLFNFLFMAPRYTLMVENIGDVRALFSFLIAAVLTGNVGGRLHDQIEALRDSNRWTEAISAIGARLAGAMELREVVAAIAAYLASNGFDEVVVMLPDPSGRLLVQSGSTEQRPLAASDQAAAHWAYERGETAGWNTETLPSAIWLFVPLTTGQGRIGVLGVRSGEGRDTLTDTEERVLDGVADLSVVAIERTQLAAKLENSRVAIETEQLRVALLSSVSHDLRTPLVSVLGAAEALKNNSAALDEEARKALLDSILEEAERLDRFVQNLLDMTRISYSGLHVKPDWHELRELIYRAQHRLKRQMRDHPVDVQIADSVPLLWVDAMLIEQVLVNLFDNAAKFSPPKAPILVRAENVGSQLILRICDQGPGIPVNDREAVFNMFHRVRSGDSRVAGTGLGLAICRGFVEAHGGRIRALAGDNGLGAAIEVTLPLQPGAPTLRQTQDPT